MANYIVTATNKNLDDYFYLLTSFPNVGIANRSQLTNYKQNGVDLNTKYLPHASANNTTDTGPTGFQYKETGTGIFQDLKQLFAMKITATIAGPNVSSIEQNTTRQVIFTGNGTITFSNASNTPFRATVIVIGAGGGGASGGASRTGQGGGGGAIAFGIITLAVGVTYTATVPGSASAGVNGGNTKFSGNNGSEIIANGGNAGVGANAGGASINTVTVTQAAGQDWVANVIGKFGGAGGGTQFTNIYENGTNASTLTISYNNGVTNDAIYYCGGGGSGSKTQGGSPGANGNGGN